MYPIAFFCANTSGVFSTAPLPTISTAAPAGTILDVTGSGIKTTRSFTIGNAWDLIWSYDCSDFGTKGNFQVYVFKADGSLSRNAGVNELDNSGNGVEHFHQGGTLYLEINAKTPAKEATAAELRSAMDWLVERQLKIEQQLARKHLSDGALVLYDLSSSYVEGIDISTYRGNDRLREGEGFRQALRDRQGDRGHWASPTRSGC